MYGTDSNTVRVTRPRFGRATVTTHHRPRNTRKDRVRAAAALPQEG